MDFDLDEWAFPWQPYSFMPFLQAGCAPQNRSELFREDTSAACKVHQLCVCVLVVTLTGRQQNKKSLFIPLLYLISDFVQETLKKSGNMTVTILYT